MRQQLINITGPLLIRLDYEKWRNGGVPVYRQ